MQKSIKKTWVLLLVVLLIFVTLSYFLSANQLKEYPPYLSTSPSPLGVKGFYTYLNEEVDSVDRFEGVPSKLKNSDNQLLIMVEPSLISEQRIMNDYISFMEAGNTILLLKNNLEGMFQISTTYATPTEDTVVIEDKYGAIFETTMFSEMRILPSSEDEVILEDDQGVVAIKRAYGNGNLIAVNSPDWVTNQYIVEAENLNVLFSLMEEENWSSIRFDEYSHRSTASQSITDIYPMWLLVASIQLILFTLLWLWYKGKRFGPIRVLREEYVRYSDERITALAAWYKKGKAYIESLNDQAEYLRLILREKWGISYQKDWKDLKEQLSLKLPMMKEEELNSFLLEIDAVLQKHEVTKQEYLLWSKRIDRLRKEVELG
ncbi:DUF4350 domain-containing protein [Ornithinibacillus sp. 179-J 7C1 HS]|uniref:DUF4350 domain-containing protein n=1 Tax=Ornithinibacillus sp. 179-J 7C1 HS TaxID=3142384 RepID=UPI0039A308CA